MKLFKATTTCFSQLGDVFHETYIVAENIKAASGQAPESDKIEFVSDRLIVEIKEDI